MHNPPKFKWANNVVTGIGKGTGSVVWEVGRGISGIVYEPYKGAKKKGFKGGMKGVGLGLAGLVGRPIKGGLTFVAQTGAGVVNTPRWIGKKLKKKKSNNLDQSVYGTDIDENRFVRFGVSPRTCECEGNEGIMGNEEEYYRQSGNPNLFETCVDIPYDSTLENY